MLRHAVRLNCLTELALTKLDVLDRFDEIKVCTEYGSTVSALAALPRSLRRAGSRRAGVPRRCRAGAPSLRDAARAGDAAGRRPGRFIELVEREVGVPVRVVGVGAERDDYLDAGTS